MTLVRASASTRRTTLDCAVAEDLPAARGDRVHLCQVLLNLIVNAMDAMEDLPQPARRVAVDLRAAANGMGMGLPISRTIVEAHGGRIWAENNPDGRGATFRFTVPAEPAASATAIPA